MDTTPAPPGSVLERLARRRDPIRVLVVDDDWLFALNLSVALELDRRLVVVGRADDGRAAINAVTRLRPDVVLMDLNMPVMDGVEATRRLLAARPRTRVLLVTSSDDERLIARGLEAGALDLVPKGTPAEDLVEAVVDVAADVVSLHHRGSGDGGRRASAA